MSLILSPVPKLKPGSDAKHFVALQHVHRGHVTKIHMHINLFPGARWGWYQLQYDFLGWGCFQCGTVFWREAAIEHS